MSFTFTVESSSLPSFTSLLAAADLGEPLQLAGAGFTGEPWPRGLFATVGDAASVASSVELTPELEASFARAGLVGSFLAFVRGSARGVVVARTPARVSFEVLALASAADYALAARLAAAAARVAGCGVGVGSAETVAPDALVAQYGPAFAEENARQMGTWLAEDVAQGRTYHFQCPRGWVTLGPEDLGDTPQAERLARARSLVLGDAEKSEVVATDPRRDAVLLTAAMVFAAGADGRLDDEEARQLEAHFATVKEFGAYHARELLDAVKTEVKGLDALRALASPALRKKAFVLASEVLASARGGNLMGEASDPNVQAVNALVVALGLEGDQAFIARVVTTLMAKYGAADVGEDVARSMVLGMLLAAAADGVVHDQESALLSALARTVPQLRSRDVATLFEAARARMDGGLDAALADFGALGGHENKCFALASEVALVAGRGPAGTLLPRLQEHIAPEPHYAECAITTFAAKYA